MPEQTYIEDVEVGTALPVLQKEQSTTRFVKWAGVSYDFTRFHYDYLHATKERGLPNVVGQGALTQAYLGQLLQDFAGPEGRVGRVRAEYRGTTWPGDVLTVSGRVAEKKEGNLVECEVWCEHQEGKKVTIGSGTVRLPSRKG